jgi:hypothetical protein
MFLCHKNWRINRHLARIKGGLVPPPFLDHNPRVLAVMAITAA